MRHFGLLVICLLHGAITTFAFEGQYTVIAPGTLHSAFKYNVAVAVHHTTTPTQIKVGITGSQYNETKIVDFQEDDVKNIEFNVPEIEKGDYNLTAEGVTGIVFKNTTKLYHASFMPYLTIQTDKGSYKPGDIVNYRVIVLDENLRPTTLSKEAIIWFEDGHRNRVKSIANLTTVKGVLSGQFQISEFPVLGYWQLHVKNGENSQTQTQFKVSKYVLPKYEVKVEATDKVAVQDGDMQVIVRANYTYGKGVDAKVTLLLKLNHYYYYGEEKEKPEEPPVLIKTANMVNGKAKFDLNVNEYLNYMTNKNSPSYMDVTATVEENFTGVQINGTTSSLLYPYRYEMNCVSSDTCYSFKADEPFEVVFQISHVDDTPVKDTKNPVYLRYTENIRKTYYWRDYGNKETTTELPTPDIKNLTFKYEGHMNETSMVVFKVTLPDLTEFKGFSHFYEVEVEYAGEKRQIITTYQRRDPKKIEEEPEEEKPDPKYFTAEAKYEKDKYSVNLGNEVKIELNSSSPLPYVVYNVMGRGNILYSKRVELPDKPKVYTIKVTTTFQLVPHGGIYVYYVDEQGEFHYAETRFYTEFQLINKIDISGPEEVKPGDVVPLKIKTEPNSFVGLLAIDQSVLLLNGNNDIHERDFRWRLGSFDTHTPPQGGYSYYPGRRSGSVTLTNADYFYNWTAPAFHAIGLSRTTYKLRDDSDSLGVTPQSEALPVNKIAAAGGAKGAGFSGSEPIAVRKDFSETWIFADIENTESAEFTWSKKIPDTITSWVVTGFSVHPEKGIGVTKDSTKIKTFQPFFIAVRLPYSVKRGEVINVPALIFNYLSKDLDVSVTLDNTDGEFDFTEVSNEVINEPKRVKTVRVPANSAAGVAFMLRPKIVGNIMLKYTAVSPIAGDAIHRSLKVVPEGVTEYANRAYFVNLKDTPEFTETFELAVPNDIVPDSEHIEFTVVGDLLGPLLNNVNRLVRLPTGCGEQTTSTMVPNYLIYRYLKTLKKLTPQLESKIKNNLGEGYQHILSFAHSDGSFSSFGPSKDPEHPHNGSTWLTAYVLRSLQQASEIVDVDPLVFQRGFIFLASQQAENGSFIETGDYFYSSQRNHITLTASVLLTFLQNETIVSTYQSKIDKGFKYILENIEKTDDLLAKALATYTLHKAKHVLATDQIAKLKTLAKTEGDRTWWSDVERPNTFWWRWPISSEVEVTSYILLTLLDLETESIQSVLPIVKWLISQRNSYGGFSSTQDTIVGLQALIKFAEKSSFEAAVMQIDFSAEGGSQEKQSINVNEENGLLLQSFELPPKTRSVNFKASGKGAALVQVAYQYNIVEKEKKPSFVITTVINKETPPFKLALDVCVEYTEEKSDASNMAVLEVSLPSGYTADEDSFDAILSVDRVRHIETKNSKTIVVVYFESLHKGEVKCLPIEAFKSFPVALQKPVPVVLYDYYETEKKATAYYEVVSKLCEICDNDEECMKACN